jgi:hypothetical protein
MQEHFTGTFVSWPMFDKVLESQRTMVDNFIGIKCKFEHRGYGPSSFRRVDRDGAAILITINVPTGLTC